MTRQLVWKEVREQFAVLVALLALGAGVVVATAILLDAPSASDGLTFRTISTPGRLALMMLVLTAGVVAGGTLFAGEREAGTFDYLDFLPGSRWSIFWRKVLTGGVLTAVAAGGLWAVALVAGLIGSGTAPIGWGVALAMIAAGGFGWGVFGSVYARNSLAACGIGLGLATVIGGVIYAGAFILLTTLLRSYSYGVTIHRDVWVTAGLVSCWGMLIVPLPIAWWVYTAPDRSRLTGLVQSVLPGAAAVRQGVTGLTAARFGASFRRLVWLFIRQHRVVALILGVNALLAGAAFLIPDVPAVIIWPLLSLAAGVLAGVITLTDEQQPTANRFWGQRRLPAGRLWLTKVTGGLLLTAVLCGLMILPSVVSAVAEQARGGRRFFGTIFRSGVLSEIEFPAVFYLTVWPVYGFAFAHLARLLFRKGLVAGAVGTLLGGTFAALWLPSLLSGGLHAWQVFAPVLVVLLVAQRLTWPWATDRLAARPTLRRLAFGGVALLVTVGFGIGYRVLEVPVLPSTDDHIRFAEGLPTFDTEQSGRDIRRAVNLFQDVPERGQVGDRRFNGVGLFGEPVPPPQNPRQADERLLLDQVWEVNRRGYPPNRPDLDRWLERMNDSRLDPPQFWEQSLADAAKKPTGVVEDPNELDPLSEVKTVGAMWPMGGVYLARGLLEQKRGAPDGFANRLPIWLATLRTYRNKSLAVVVANSYALERASCQAVDRWLEKLDGHPKLIRTCLAAVVAHDLADRLDTADLVLAEQVIIANAVNSPSQWLPKYLDQYQPAAAKDQWRYGEYVGKLSETEAGLVAVAWAVPWEKERLRRVIGLGNQLTTRPQVNLYLAGAPGSAGLLPSTPNAGVWSVSSVYNEAVTERRATILKLAVRLYHAENGRFPTDLAQLVPKYLTAMPLDPATNRPYQYEIATVPVIGDGEEQGTWFTQPGQPILSSDVQLLRQPPTASVVAAVPGSTALLDRLSASHRLKFPVPLPPGKK